MLTKLLSQEKLIFNGIDLKNYLEKAKAIDYAHKKKLEKSISLIGGPYAKKAYPFELDQIEDLRMKAIEYHYPKFNSLSFLEKSIEIERDIETEKGEEMKIKFKIPKYIPFEFFGSNSFSFRLSFDRENNPIYKEGKNTTSRYRSLCEINFDRNSRALPKIFEKSLKNSFEFFGSKINGERIRSPFYYHFPPKKGFDSFGNNNKLIEEINYLEFNNQFRTKFNCLIVDEEVRKNISDSLKFFKKEELYLIAERKEEDWEITTSEKDDPIILGLFDQKIPFLIDLFYPTPEEEYISKIYTENNN